MEKIQENFLSEEQQERQKKFAELLDIMSSLTESFVDSNEAYEVATEIEDFKNRFETGDLRLKDYLLGGVLLSSEDTFDLSKYEFFDTENGDIESFIREFDKRQLGKKTA